MKEILSHIKKEIEELSKAGVPASFSIHVNKDLVQVSSSITEGFYTDFNLKDEE